MVKVELNRIEGDYHMVATNDRGNVLHLDDGGKEGGLGAGFGPMQSLLAAVGGCSSAARDRCRNGTRTCRVPARSHRKYALALNYTSAA